MPSKPHVREITEDAVRRMAKIFPDGAAAQALAEADDLRAGGDEVAFFEGEHRGQRYILVGPLLSREGELPK